MSEFDSSFDTLTDLYNRAAFHRAAKQIEETKAFSVIILDINDFKNNSIFRVGEKLDFQKTLKEAEQMYQYKKVQKTDAASNKVT